MKSVLNNPEASPPHQAREPRRRKVTDVHRDLASQAKTAKSLEDLNIKVRYISGVILSFTCSFSFKSDIKKTMADSSSIKAG